MSDNSHVRASEGHYQCMSYFGLSTYVLCCHLAPHIDHFSSLQTAAERVIINPMMANLENESFNALLVAAAVVKASPSVKLPVTQACNFQIQEVLSQMTESFSSIQMARLSERVDRVEGAQHQPTTTLRVD